MLMVRAIDSDHRLTFEEYLAFEEASDIRHELVDGHVYAFAGASDRHNLICSNLIGTLWTQARGTGCRVFGSDMKVRVSARVSYYPDVTVACDPEDNHSYYRSRPSLLVEVLSPSTALVDRREKLIAYQSIASLRGYLMVYRDEFRIEAYTRNGDDVWDYANLTADDDVWFPCVDLTVPVMALYEDVDMSPIVPPADEPDIR